MQDFLAFLRSAVNKLGGRNASKARAELRAAVVMQQRIGRSLLANEPELLATGVGEPIQYNSQFPRQMVLSKHHEMLVWGALPA